MKQLIRWDGHTLATEEGSSLTTEFVEGLITVIFAGSIVSCSQCNRCNHNNHNQFPSAIDGDIRRLICNFYRRDNGISPWVDHRYRAVAAVS